MVTRGELWRLICSALDETLSRGEPLLPHERSWVRSEMITLLECDLREGRLDQWYDVEEEVGTLYQRVSNRMRVQWMRTLAFACRWLAASVGRPADQLALECETAFRDAARSNWSPSTESLPLFATRFVRGECARPKFESAAARWDLELPRSIPHQSGDPEYAAFGLGIRSLPAVRRSLLWSAVQRPVNDFFWGPTRGEELLLDDDQNQRILEESSLAIMARYARLVSY